MPAFQSDPGIDAQYNAGAAVADFAAELGHYVETAAAARATLRASLGVPYGDTPAQTLDVFPADSPGAPVFVFLHGGYWRSLSAKDFHGVALGLQPLGVTTVVVDYALCPSVTIDEIVRQVRTAHDWVLRNIAAFGGDADRLALGGHSAGAHLAAMCLGGPDGYAPPRAPAAALLVSGIYDLAPLQCSYLQPQLRLDAGIIDRNSPLRFVPRSPTRLWITWGEEESSEFARQSSRYHAAWSGAGNAAHLSPQAQAHHFSAIHGFEVESSPLCRWLVDELGARGAGSAA